MKTSNRKLKIVTLIGTRPEIIKLSRVIPHLDIHTNHKLVHTGQNHDYELNQVFFKDLDLREPDHFLAASSTSASKTIAKVIENIEPILLKEKPDAFLVLGDTNSAFGALVAKKLRIPIFHMEAGNRCFDMRVPEEVNRKIIDHLSDINLPYTDIARNYLLAEGMHPSSIIKTGSPMQEVINYYMPAINQSTILQKLKLNTQKFFLVSCHREENIENDILFHQFIESLHAIYAKYKLPILVSTHPRMRNKLKKLNLKLNSNIIFHKPFAFSDYIKLMLSSHTVLSDSGTITEEASILKIRAINIRETHERPEGSEEATCILAGMNSQRIMQSIKIISQDSNNSNFPKKIADYDVDIVSKKVLRIILSHVDYVNKYFWRK
ncbi:UDP-N-acetylglucosamine 2-epimerase (non-hydrolyzing) [Gammaproteobacteria bacterium]|jgi:UDP-N-acetylglucosamine 2-epimerase|nr:UDP-N-acetylglucosamine 2-epimerase (non-hydrolyzing) [Gammaproteobacteria bacterium]